MTWSRLEGTELCDHVFEYIDSHNDVLRYHTTTHIRRLWELAEQFNVPYNLELDIAILMHDVIYDGKPFEVLRSAQFMYELYQIHPDWFMGADRHTIWLIIMTTKDHVLQQTVTNNLIYLDLGDLSFPEIARKNSKLINEESQLLYDISAEDAALYAIDFLTKFIHITNNNRDNDPEHNQFWSDVLTGINISINEAQQIAYPDEDDYFT